MNQVATMARPQRWDQPFGPEMTDDTVAALLARPELSDIDPTGFPKAVPLEGIFKNDSRLVKFSSGDIVIREGDYGSSAFLLLSGSLQVVIDPPLPEAMLGRQSNKRISVFQSIAQLFTNTWNPERRDPKSYGRNAQNLRGDADHSQAFLQDIPGIIRDHQTFKLPEGALFGELAALGRIPRTATIFADGDAELLEIRWQGLRELRKYDPTWRERIETSYRKNALDRALREHPLFEHLDDEALAAVAEKTLFETYGSFDWHGSYKQMRQKGQLGIKNEPVIAKQGDYPDGVLMIRAGFARVSAKLGNGQRTLTYLGAGDVFAMDELYAAWSGKNEGVALQTAMTALGYVDVLRIPAPVLEEYVFPNMDPPTTALEDLSDRALSDDKLMEWAVEERFINGTKSMLIDLDKCVRCDDCVRACASTHGGNPRFLRHGKIFDHWMVANACQHCKDPVCLIGCPTGAIHRNQAAGTVIINDRTCIACGTCANSCPYDNIRLVEINDMNDRPLTDEAGKPIMKATKCDLCTGQLGGPACVRACPHDALRRVDFQELELGDEV